MEFPEAPEGYELVCMQVGREKHHTPGGLMHMTYEATYKKIAPEPRTATICDIGHWVEHDPIGKVRLICIDMGWAWYQDSFGRGVCPAAELKTTVPLGWRNVNSDDKTGTDVVAGSSDQSACKLRGRLVHKTEKSASVLSSETKDIHWFSIDKVWVFGRIES